MAVMVARSALPDIVWPALPAAPAAVTLALQYQLRRSERWDAAQLEAHQFAQLEHLLAHCDRTMPFWRRRLRAAGIQPGDRLTAESWARLPILSRAEAQEAGTALHCLSVPAAHGGLQRKATSGSTGRPLQLVKTDLHQKFWDGFVLRDLFWHRLDLMGTWASFRRDPSGIAGPGQDLQSAAVKPVESPELGPPVSEIYPSGPLSVYEIRRPIPEQAAWLLRQNPDYLMTFPTHLAELAQYFRDTGQKLPRLRAARVVSEAVTADQRVLCRAVFGVEILDAYSAEEIGYMALQCPDVVNDEPPLHVMAEGVKLEVLDAAGQPCRPGEIGRVVVTPLHNFAMPLLRYELGDYAEVGPSCPCGRGLPVLSGIRGRLRHGIVMPDGGRRAAYFSISFHQVAAIRQHQAAQIAPDVIELRLVVRRPLTAAEEDTLTRLVRNDTDPSFKVRFAYVDAIPRLPNGKYEEFRCEVV